MSAWLWGLADPAVLVCTLVLAAVLLVISVIDGRTQRIPDLLSLPLIALGLGAAAWVSNLPLRDHVIGAAAGYAVLWLVAAVYLRARGREGLGLGDAKLLAAGGAWLGWPALPSVLVASSFAGLAGYALAAALGRGAGPDARIPFGPYLAFGIMLVWLAGSFSAPAVWR